MSGSGSSLFGIFKEKADKSAFEKQFPDCRVFILDIL